MHLRTARHENEVIKSFEKCFKEKVEFNSHFAKSCDNGDNWPRCWTYHYCDILRTMEERERKCIGRVEKILVPVYTVYTYVSSGYSHWEPPDVEEVEVGTFDTLAEALLEVDKMERQQAFANFCEGEFWAEQAKLEDAFKD